MNHNAGGRSITGLNPVSDIDCDELNVNGLISIQGDVPITKKFLAYNPSTQTTIYDDVEAASDLDIVGLTELNAAVATDFLIIYDSGTQTNKKIAPENIQDPDMVATAPLSITGINIQLATDADFSVVANQLALTNKTISGINLGGTLNTMTINFGATTVIYDGSVNKSITITDNDTTYSAGTGLTLTGTTFDFTGGNLASVNITNIGSITSNNSNLTLTQGSCIAQNFKLVDNEANEYGQIQFADEYNVVQLTLKSPNYNVMTAYTLTFPLTKGTNGQVLTTDGNGTTDWTTPSGGSFLAGTGLTLTGTTFDFTGGNLASVNITNIGSITSNSSNLTLTQGSCIAQNFKLVDNEANEYGQIQFADEYNVVQLTLKSPNYNVMTAYTLTFPLTKGTNGQVLTTDGNGTTDWTTPSGGSNEDLDITINGTLTTYNGTAPQSIDIDIPAIGHSYYTTTDRFIKILPTHFCPNDDSSYYNLGIVDGNATANTLYGGMKAMTSVLEAYAEYDIPEGYELYSYRIALRSTSTYGTVLRTTYCKLGFSASAGTRVNLISGASNPYTNYDVVLPTPQECDRDNYIILGVALGSTADVILGGWLRIRKV